MNPADPKATGLAALTVCESLLLGLVDKGVLDEEERKQILLDAAAAHRTLAERDDAEGLHGRVAAIIERLTVEAGSTMRAFDIAANGSDANGSDKDAAAGAKAQRGLNPGAEEGGGRG